MNQHTNMFHKRNSILAIRPLLAVFAVPCFLLLLITTANALLPPLPIDQVAQIAYNAGFRGDSLATAIAISFAESSFIPDNILVNTDGSRDRGLWQINDKAHPDVNDACAFAPACNASAAYVISKNGTNWQPWSSTYGGTRYNQEYPLAVQAAAKFNGTGGGVADPSDIYVSLTGSDASNGSAGAPFRTIKHAIDMASTTQPVTINIAPGSYGEKIGTSLHIHFLTWGAGTVQTGG